MILLNLFKGVNYGKIFRCNENYEHIIFWVCINCFILAIISKSKSKSKKVVIILDVILLLIGLTGMIIQFFYS